MDNGSHVAHWEPPKKRTVEDDCDTSHMLQSFNTLGHQNSSSTGLCLLTNRCKITHGPGNTQSIFSSYGGILLHDSRTHSSEARALLPCKTVKCLASNPRCQFHFAVGDAGGLSMYDVRMTNGAIQSSPLLSWEYTNIMGDTYPFTELVFHHLPSETAGEWDVHNCVLCLQSH